MVPIRALACEHHEDPEMRPFDKPILDDQREELIIGGGAGVMRMHRYFLKHRNLYTPPAGTFMHQRRGLGHHRPHSTRHPPSRKGMKNAWLVLNQTLTGATDEALRRAIHHCLA